MLPSRAPRPRVKALGELERADGRGRLSRREIAKRKSEHGSIERAVDETQARLDACKTHGYGGGWSKLEAQLKKEQPDGVRKELNALLWTI